MDTLLDFLKHGGNEALFWLATTLLAYLSLLVRAKIKNTETRNFLVRVFDEIEDAVRSIEQTFVSSARDDKGKLTPEDQIKAKTLAMSTIRSNLGPKNLKRLQKVVGVQADKWFDTRIEATLHDHKRKNGVNMKMVPYA